MMAKGEQSFLSDFVDRCERRPLKIVKDDVKEELRSCQTWKNVTSITTLQEEKKNRKQNGST